MEPRAHHIRPFAPGDYEAEARVHADLDPTVVFSPRELAHWDAQSSQPPFVLRKWVATEPTDSAVVGIGALQSDIEHYEPTTFWVGVDVVTAHQGRGVGRALAEAVVGEAVRLGARRLWAAARGTDARGLHFLARQGFAEVRRTWRSRLTLSDAPALEDRTAVLRRQGITFTTLAAEDPTDPATLRGLYDLSAEASTDEPHLGPYTPLPFEMFVELEVRGPSVLPDAYFLAKDGARYVGLSALRKMETQPDALHQAFTGTLREYRGRGIATELKRRGLEYARAHGYREIFVGNDSLNAPMLAINRKLGFRPERERIIGERRVAIPSGTASP